MAKLDLDTDIKNFKLWELQAEDYLAPGRPEIQQLLTYAATSGMPITKQVEATWSTPQLDVPTVSATIFSGIMSITTGAVLNRLVLQAGKGNGLEMWRLIFHEWRNKSPQVMSTYRNAYENPIRCKTTEEVRVKLAEWQNYGAEYESYSGQKFSEHGHLDALKKFLPENMSQQVDTQMTWNHKTFAECLNWVKIHIREQHSYS